MLKIGITTGDVDGIGLEIALKALESVGPQRGTCFFLMRSHSVPKNHLSPLEKKWEVRTFSSLAQALDNSETRGSSKILFEIVSDQLPPFWVVDSTKACLSGRLDGICTGPLSKTLIHAAGLKDLGHTEIFKRLSHCEHVNMGFIGRYFSVILATDHIPLNKVPSKLTPQLLKTTLDNAKNFVSLLPAAKRRLPIALLGLNPHAGECGLLGGEEEKLVEKLKFYLKKQSIEGPIPPDVAFFRCNWSKYSVYVATYHDQGLIPFKMIHGQDSGVHISLGLPFVRTSVDHGTAKDIYGKGCANPKSMIEAIIWCQRLARLRKKGGNYA
ncbi:MAG: 4-hydroxythreonine-4-phosphate dehydrogenase PdxA [Bdellovibrionales bacterium]|nr:4-hydroxythreonine-4-phosphate dehydrogenase PdxA [Bdellovibrionales bacterium]